MNDIEILLLSWTQLVAMEWINPQEEEFIEGRRQLEEQLARDYQIRHLQVVGRTYEEYAVAYEQEGVNKMIRFSADEVESIYNLR